MDETWEGGMGLVETASHVSQLLAVGQKRRAREMAASLVARSPDDPSAHLVLSQVHAALGDLEPAQAAADQVVRLAPDDDRGHAQRGRVLFLRGRFADAERAIREALALDASDASTYLLRARLLAACERHASALEAVEQALRLEPDDPEAHQLRAFLLLKTRPGQWKVSEETALRAVQLDPDDADGHAVLGSVYLRSGRTREAEERFRAALTRDPGNALALRGLSEAVMARSFLYRPFLRFSRFMESAGHGAQLAVIAGLWALVNAAVPLLNAGEPPLPSLSFPLQIVYLALCAYTWFAAPITRAILARQYPWLRQIHE
jgi:tetratricopeptide (TPR) repeat protein